VLVLDGQRSLLAANRAARELLGIGATGQDLARSIRHPAVLAAVETIASGVPLLTDEIELPVPVARAFTLHAARLPGASGADAPMVLLALHDETRARRAERSRVDFVANVSHELRSPLSALIGFIETLRGPARGDTEAEQRFLGIMQREALRMAALIEDLLSLSRVEINEHIPPRDAVDVALLLEDVASALAGRAAARTMDIALDIPADLTLAVGDGDQLTQVFHNLVENAIKYGRAGSTIRVNARPVARLRLGGGPGPAAGPAGGPVGGLAGGLAITVSDESDGIPPEALPRITERFYRLDQGRSRQTGGTGLGLAIVKHIVNRHRGQLKIESRLGKGSDFTVFLPAAEGARRPDLSGDGP
jgi:two-component system, OmpR family, phosphate regulon sensor histidine kinase PhoR